MSVLRWLPGIVLLIPWLLAPVAPANETRIRDLSGPYSFRLLDWETVHLADRASRLWAGLFGSGGVAGSDADVLQSYFRAGAARIDKRSAAEGALERVVARAYTAG